MRPALTPTALLLTALLTTLLTTAVLRAPCAHAEDEPAFAQPGFSVQDITSTEEEHPEAWTPLLVAGSLPDSAPTAGRLLALAKAAGLDTSTFNARSRPFQGKDGATGVVAIVGLDAPATALAKPLAGEAVKNGWVLRELGTPNRVLVVWASTQEAAKALMQWQLELAVRKLSNLAFTRRQNAMREGDRADFDAAVALLEEVGEIAPDAGAFHALKGIFMHQQGSERALPHFRKALEEKCPIPAQLKWRVFIAGELGMTLLLNGSDEVLDEAARALAFAVAHESETKQPLARFGNRYNLACAYARLGKKDEAFQSLEGSLKLAQAELVEQYAAHYAHCKDTDTDLASLREDERFAALMQKYAPAHSK